MNLYFLSFAPKVFTLFEACFGTSRLQNHDAILRNFFVRNKTDVLWRFTLTVIAILQVTLSLAYKEFDNGKSENEVTNKTGNSYGFAPPASLQDRRVAEGCRVSQTRQCPLLPPFTMIHRSPNSQSRMASILCCHPTPPPPNLMLLLPQMFYEFSPN